SYSSRFRTCRLIPLLSMFPIIWYMTRGTMEELTRNTALKETTKNTRFQRAGSPGDGTRQFRTDFTSFYWRWARNSMARSRESILQRQRFLLGRADGYFPKALRLRPIPRR